MVKKLIPGAKITVERGPEKNVAGLAASVSDKNIGLELGFKRKFSPMEVGIEAMIKDVRDRAEIRCRLAGLTTGVIVPG